MTDNKIILGIVSEIGGGKGTATAYLKEKYGAQTLRFSTMLRDILNRLHLPDTRENMQELSTIIRQNFGQDTMSRVIAQDAKNSDAKIVVTEGIRRPDDIIYLKGLGNFYLVAIEVDERARYERIVKRGENPDDATKTWDEFLTQSKEEPEQKIKELMKSADYTIDNNETLGEFYSCLDEIIRRIQAKTLM